jgi:hypothetical protein
MGVGSKSVLVSDIHPYFRVIHGNIGGADGSNPARLGLLGPKCK